MIRRWFWCIYESGGGFREKTMPRNADEHETANTPQIIAAIRNPNDVFTKRLLRIELEPICLVLMIDAKLQHVYGSTF